MKRHVVRWCGWGILWKESWHFHKKTSAISQKYRLGRHVYPTEDVIQRRETILRKQLEAKCTCLPERFKGDLGLATDTQKNEVPRILCVFEWPLGRCWNISWSERPAKKDSTCSSSIICTPRLTPFVSWKKRKPEISLKFNDSNSHFGSVVCEKSVGNVFSTFLLAFAGMRAGRLPS